MSLQAFFRQFSALSDAPNGVEQLRELILQLAVQGHLGTHNLSDDPAASSLNRIEHARAQLTKEKQIRATQPLPDIQSNEIPFDIPESWQWIRLGEIGDWGAGATPNRKNSRYYDGDIRWFKSGELNNGHIQDSEEKITQEALKACSLRVNQPGDVLIAMYGATIGKLAILEAEATTNQAVCACTCFDGFDNGYLFWLLRSYKRHFTGRGAGGAQPNISREKIIHTVAPLPPLEEQKRIVTRIDELMRLCDELEARQQAKREGRMRLNVAVLAPLNKAASLEPKEFEQATAHIADNFDTLYDSIDTVSKLRATILQLAVQGKLISHDRQDEAVGLFLERLGKQRQKLLTPSELKKVEPQRSSDHIVLPFGVPEGWKWTRLGKISTKLGAGSTPLGGKNVYQPEGVKFLRSQNVWDQGLQLNNVAYISETIHKEMNGTHVQDGDILLNITGASIGRSCVVPEHFGPANVSQHVSIIRLVDKRLRFFIHLCIISPYVQDSIMETQVGISREGLSMRNLKEFLLPIPPLAEQKRIVGKVHQLMSLCDELEAKLRQAGADSEKLMNAAVKHVLDSVRNVSKTAKEVSLKRVS